ncbi:MAG: hypothetical protein ACE5I1_04370, partial [bacterium]
MLFKKKTKPTSQQFPFSGKAVISNGLTAIAEVAVKSCDEIGVHSLAGLQQVKAKICESEHTISTDETKNVAFQEANNGSTLAGIVSGFALTGLRASAFTNATGLVDMHNALFSAAGKRLPFVINTNCQALEKHGATNIDGHDAYHAVADAGCFQLFAKNAQEAVDFALIAHRIAEMALTPGIVAFDSQATGHLEQSVLMPKAEFVAKFLGSSDDLIATPTPAQRILFGEKRRRIPELLNLDRPLGIGATQDGQTYSKSIASQRPFFLAHLAEIAAQAFSEFGELTGRVYSPVSSYKVEGADYVVIVQGALTTEVEKVVDHLRQNKNIKAGILTLAMFRPFPGAVLSKRLHGKKAVAVLECLDQPLAEDLPILQEVRSAFDKANENGAARNGPLPYPAYATYQKPTDRPQIFSGVQTTSPTFDGLLAIFKNMLPNGSGKKFFYAGVHFFKPAQRYPKLEMLQQQLRKDYPDLDKYTLPPNGSQEQPHPSLRGTKQSPGSSQEIASSKTPRNDGGVLSERMARRAIYHAQEQQSPPEPEAPWTVKKVKTFDRTIYDLERFWDSVGFLHETGQAEQTLPDPFVATGAVPAHSSSAFRNARLVGKQIIKLTPENLAACNVPRLLAFAPDAGLQATLQNVASILETAIRQCEREGQNFTHMPRISQNLVKLAYRLVAKDDQQKYRYAGALFRDAFAGLMEKMAPKDEQRTAFEQEIQAVCDVLETYIIVKTKQFFEEPHAKEKGTGLLLSYAINPDAYIDGSACLKCCPENAMEWVEATDELLRDYKKNWRLLMQMPEVPIERLQHFISPDKPETVLLYLINQRVYHSMLTTGGDHPAYSARAAMRLAAAAAETVMQPRVQTLVQKLTDLIQKLENKIRGKITESLQINDFEAFGKRLSEEGDQPFDLESLAHVIQEEQDEPAIDKERLARLTTLLSKLKELYTLYLTGANGDGRAHMAATFALQHTDGNFSSYPYNPFSFPWVLQASGNSHAQAIGIFHGLMQKMRDTFMAIRMAELELADHFKPNKHEPFFNKFTWTDFTPEERELCPPVFVVTDAESGTENVSRLLASGLPIKILFLNASGLQIPEFSDFSQTGEISPLMNRIVQNEPGLLALIHRQCFVLQSSIGLPEHLLQGIMAGIAFDGAAFFHIYAPDLREQNASAARLYSLAEIAVASRAFPVFTYNPNAAEKWGKCLNLQANPQPEDAWTMQTLEVSQAGGLVDKIAYALTPADWAALAGRFESHFKSVKAKQWHDAMTPLSEYIALAPDKREGIEPFIQFIDQQQHLQRLAVSQKIVAMAEDRQAFWQFLNSLATLESTTTEQIEEQVNVQVEMELSREKEAIVREYEAKLAQLQNEHDRLYHAKLTQKLLAMSGYGQDSQKLAQKLREFAMGEKSIGEKTENNT